MKKMTRIREKISLCLIAAYLLTGPNKASAQLQYIPAAIHPFSIGFGAGFTTLYGDLEKNLHMPAYKGNLDYNITPYVSAGIEGQYGKMAQGYKTEGGTYSEIHFYTANANIRAGLGQALKPTNNFTQFISGLYIGSGVGYINSQVDKISTLFSADEYLKNQAVVVPINLGINEDLPIYKVVINLNYQYDVAFNDILDGYKPNVAANKNNDAYSLLSLSVKYCFGNVRH